MIFKKLFFIILIFALNSYPSEKDWDKKGLEKITYYSHGIPRLINVICDSALLEAYIEKREKIGEDIIERIASMRRFK